ncbi:MAG: gamma-glutamyl-gamma-aminobutyrate hydrolase family protein [Pseudomonadota bacterium]
MIKRQPLVGVTSDYHKTGDIFKGPAYFIGENYISAVEEAGGIPVVLPYSSDKAVLEELLTRIDGILITGGNFDINPAIYGQKPIDRLGALNDERTAFEMEITRIGLESNLPILGICGGEQLLNVVVGGSLYQDIGSQVKGASNHQQTIPKSELYHSITIEHGTKLHSILECDTIDVNSTHHQSIKEVGKGCVVNAKAGDGIIEGIESTEHTFVLGVQWHPEFLYQKEKRFKRLFEEFVRSCKERH